MQLFTFFAPLSVQMPIEGMVMSTTTKICFDGPWIFTTVKIIHKVWNSILLLLLFPISLSIQFWILSRNAYFSTFVWKEDQIENPFEIKSLLPSEILAMILIEEDSFHHVKMWGKLNTHSYSDYGFLSLSWIPFWIRVSFSCSSKYISMTTLLTYSFAHSTKPSSRPKTNNQPLKKFLSLGLSWS